MESENYQAVPLVNSQDVNEAPASASGQAAASEDALLFGAAAAAGSSPGRSSNAMQEHPAPDAGRAHAHPPHHSHVLSKHDESRQYISDLLDNPDSSIAATVIHYFICSIILVSTVTVILETMPELHPSPLFFPWEMCITAIFTLEFTLRLYACDSMGKFVANPYNIIDFLAIFPGYLELVLLILRASQNSEELAPGHTVDRAAQSMRTLRMIRIVRLVRVFRVLRMAKFARHSQSLNIIFAVVVKVSKSGLIVVLMMMCFATVLSASLIFLTESEVCEDTGMHCHGPSAFTSIPAAFWWAIATLTTVGYGDMVPHTVGGKIIGGLTAVTGMIVVAIGIAMVSINFRECYIEEKARASQDTAHATPGKPGSEEEIDELLERFQDSSTKLFEKLKDISESRLGSQTEELSQFSTMLHVLTKHSEVFSDDVKTFKRHVLT